MKVGGFDIVNSKCDKLLGVNFDHKLTINQNYVKLANFEYWAKFEYQYASQQINALARVAPYMSILKLGPLINAFLKPQFN